MRMLMILLLTCSTAVAQDTRFIKLEQDKRNLERQVQSLTRQLDEVRLQLRSGSARTSASGERSQVSSTRDWLDAANWKRIKVGDAELEVIDALGPPTSMRQDGQDRVLLYAMEIGASGFLGGSVTLREKAVVSVELPTLK